MSVVDEERRKRAVSTASAWSDARICTVLSNTEPLYPTSSAQALTCTAVVHKAISAPPVCVHEHRAQGERRVPHQQRLNVKNAQTSISPNLSAIKKNGHQEHKVDSSQ